MPEFTCLTDIFIINRQESITRTDAPKTKNLLGYDIAHSFFTETQ